MKKTFSNRPIAAIVIVFTLISAWLLHGNPFGEGTITWPVALLVALVGNLFLAYVIAAWAAPYLASTGGRAGAEQAAPHEVVVAERWTAGTLLMFASLALLAVTLAAAQLVITPTDRLEQNAELVKRTVDLEAPEIYKRQLTAADTWKMSDRTYRSCVPTPEVAETGWCVVAQVKNGELVVVKYGFGKSNAAQALEWHPELAKQKR
ncbi:MAG: hypothetical protein HYX29_02985 [Solirubrobacterales bacterium]|nr:hypothetical protein [Solirubrobacterales bacterium]